MSLELEHNNLPTHIGIIMDGNGRWATIKIWNGCQVISKE